VLCVCVPDSVGPGGNGGLVVWSAQSLKQGTKPTCYSWCLLGKRSTNRATAPVQDAPCLFVCFSIQGFSEYLWLSWNSVDQAGLELTDPSVSASIVLGLKVSGPRSIFLKHVTAVPKLYFYGFSRGPHSWHHGSSSCLMLPPA